MAVAGGGGRGSILHAGVAYNLFLTFDMELGNPIDGLDEGERSKILELWQFRWLYFHDPIYTASFILHPGYCRNEFSKQQTDEFEKYLKKITTASGKYKPKFRYSQVKSDYADFEEALQLKTNDFNETEDGAFSREALSKPPYKWWKVWADAFPAIQWVGIILGAQKVGSGCAETDWSTRKWMQEGRYNTRGKELINNLVRIRSCLFLQPYFNALKTHPPCPWDIECIIPEPESDDEDDRRKARAVADEGDNLPTRRVFVADDDDNGSLFGDPDADLEVGSDDEE